MSTLIFDQTTHSYTVDGEPYPSVTHILADLGIVTYWQGDPKYRERGQAVHTLCTEYILKGRSLERPLGRWDPATTHPELVPYGMAFVRFLDDTGFQPDLIECPVHSKKYRVAGRLDLWGRIESSTTLVDLKSGFEPPPAWRLQTALYEFCLEEIEGKHTDRRMAVQLMDDGRPRIHNGAKPADVQVALSAVVLYHWRRNNK